jgi:hypothetical protein
MKPEVGLRRPSAQEATVFWLLMVSLAITGNIVIGRTIIGAGELLPVALYIALAYLCWRGVRVAFLIVPMGLVLGGVLTLVFAYQNAPAESYAVVFHALGVFYSWRAYREMKAGT